MKMTISTILAICSMALGFSGKVVAAILFHESIDQKATYRFTVDQDNVYEPIFEETTDGNSLFGKLVEKVEYTHSINGIEPPIFPDGEVKSANLTLDIQLAGGETFSININDLDFSEASQFLKVVKDDSDNANEFSVNIEISPLIEGIIWIEVEADSEEEHEDNDDRISMGLSDDDDKDDELLILIRSSLEVVYEPSSVTSTEYTNQYLPNSYWLADNYPNPFNPTTTIKYNIPKRSFVDIQIINTLGEKVRTLEYNYQPAGTYTLVWDGKSDRGKQVPSGVYLYRLQAGNIQFSKKMIMLK